MGEKLIHEILLLDSGQGIINIQSQNLISLLKLGAFHFYAAGVVHRSRTKLKLSCPAIGDVTSRTPIGRSIANRMHDWRKRGQTVSIGTAVPLRLHLPLDALQKFRHRLNVIQPLVVLREFGDDKRIIFITI